MTSKITITLHSDWQDPSVPAYSTGMGVKGISATVDSEIDIHGVVRHPTWTYLGGTANAGSTTVQLAEPVTWVPGDKIVVTSTDYDRWRPGFCWDFFDPRCDFTADSENPQTQSEVREVVSVSADGRSVTIDKGLRFMHWGQKWQSGSDVVDTRGEVALLTRNIVIRGDISGNSAAKGFGSHMKFDEGSAARLTGVETYHAGQSMFVGRYPIHFHLAKDQVSSFVKYCSIHDTFQRALTIHWTNDLQVHGNVAFNTSGHMYFFEDAVEANNNLTWNIGIHAKPHTLVGTDNEPAIFWVTYPYNHFEHNVAVGGNFGWWFAMPQHPVALAKGYEPWRFWDRFQKQGTFRKNTAHSQFDSGLFYDRGIFDGTSTSEGLTDYTPRDWQASINLTLMEAYYAQDLLNSIDKVNPAGRAADVVFNSPVVPTLILDFTAWKCRQFGIWHRGDYLWVVGARLADNLIGILMPGRANLAEDIVIVGETDNTGNILDIIAPGWSVSYDLHMNGRQRPTDYDPWATIKGWSFYDAGGPDIVLNARIYNFVDQSWTDPDSSTVQKRSSGAVGGQTGPNALPPVGKVHSISMSSVTNPVIVDNVNNDDGSIGLAVQDMDGSLLGTCGAWAVSMFGNHIWDSSCTLKPSWNMYQCPSTHRVLGFSLREIWVAPPGCAGTACDPCFIAQQSTAYANITCSDRTSYLTVPTNLSSDVNDPGYAVYLQFQQLLRNYNAQFYRVRDGAIQQLQPDLDTEGTQVSLNFLYNNNLKGGEEYIFQFPSGGPLGLQGAPEDVRFVLGPVEHGNWVIIGIPFHPASELVFVGLTYSGTESAINSSVATRALLRSSTENAYFWDSSAGILWLKSIALEHNIRFDGVAYRYMYGMPQAELTTYFHVLMNCPNHNCSHPTTFDPTVITPTTGSDPIPQPLSCHRDRVRATFSVSSRNVIYGVSSGFKLNWGPVPWASILFDSAGTLEWRAQGAAGVGAGYQWEAFGMYKLTGEGLNGATHLHFRLKCTDSSLGDCYPGLFAFDLAGTQLGAGVSLSHPDYLNNGPLTSGGGLQDVYVPLSELGVSGTFYGFFIFPGALWDQNRPFGLQVDTIELVTASKGTSIVGTISSTGLYTSPAWSGTRETMPYPKDVPANLGSSCSSNSDCGALICAGSICSQPCQDIADCFPNQSCLTSSSICVSTCVSDSDCPTSTTCTSDGCVPDGLVAAGSSLSPFF